MEHPEYVTYVVIVYAVTFGLLAAYLLWLWRRLQAERDWAAQHAPLSPRLHQQKVHPQHERERQ